MSIREVDVATVQQRAADVVLVDVREASETVSGHAPGALLRPLSEMRIAWPADLPQARTLAFICATGQRSREAAALALEAGAHDAVSVAGGMRAWIESGGPVEQPALPFDAERYARQMILPEVRVEGQRRLHESTVAIVGAGGLGSPVAIYLAAAGVGTLRLIDDDEVACSNLHRQILYASDDVATPKIEAAANRLHCMNPEVVVDTRKTRLTATNAPSLLADAQIVVDCSDNLDTRYAVNDACVAARVPLVYGAIFRFEGQVSVFGDRADAPCYRCLFPEPPPRELTPSCAEAGVLGVLPGAVGTAQAIEVIKLILGIGDTLSGRLMTYNALTARYREVRLRQDPQCSCCA